MDQCTLRNWFVSCSLDNSKSRLESNSGLPIPEVVFDPNTNQEDKDASLTRTALPMEHERGLLIVLLSILS